MSDVLTQLVFGLGCGGIGWFSGLAMSWREYRLGKLGIIEVPTLPKTPRQQALVLVVVGMLSVVSTAYMAIRTSEQAQCNADLVNGQIERANAAQQDRKIIDNMIYGLPRLLSAPIGDARSAAFLNMVQEYKDGRDQTDAKRSANPVPVTRC